MKSRLAVPDSLYTKPLLFGLEKPDSPFEIVTDIPAQNAFKFSRRAEEIRCAFLTPIDYARHGAEYSIVPAIGVSSSQSTKTIQLFVKSDVSNIKTIAVDIRVTSEIILAKIVLLEKFRNFLAKTDIQFIPMLPDVDAMLAKADAALVVYSAPPASAVPHRFSLDLVEEWNDLTDLPYVHGFWVGREEELSEQEAQALLKARKEGVIVREKLAEHYASQLNLPLEKSKSYLGSFSFELGEREQESLSEFMRYAYFYGIIGDVPDVRFFDVPTSSSPSLN